MGKIIPSQLMKRQLLKLVYTLYWAYYYMYNVVTNLPVITVDLAQSLH